jgi:hypothetical protein
MNRTLRKVHWIATALIAIAAVAFVSFSTGGATNAGDDAAAAQKQEIASEIATLFRSARAVISTNQELINDASKGDKGLGADMVIAQTKENFAKAINGAFPERDPSTLLGQAQTAMFSSIKSVMDKAQPVINEQGKGFKGFLPAVFAKQVADEFTKSMEGKVCIKLTAPKAYTRNRANRPDEWENNVIQTMFSTPEWQNGKTFSEASTFKGKPAYRFIMPEYYVESCLKCHGQPKGELDITGGKMEGGVLGELGGAVSVVLYDDAVIAGAPTP